MQNFCITHEEAPKKMNTLRKQCAVVILTLMLAVSVYAGQIQGPGAVSDTSTGTGTSTTTLYESVTTTVILTAVSVMP
jgi:hypothetical protein